MKKYIKLIRIKHWVKNLLIFIPIFSSRNINLENIIRAFLLFFSFSLSASFIYIINDIKDKEKDKLHERKKIRPIASGAISVKKALLIAIFLLFFSFAINFTIFRSIINFPNLYLITYIFINLSYSMKLKNYPIIDVLLLASGFVIRIFYGASIVNVPVSSWLFLTTLSASLFLGLGKRKKELLTNNNVRGVLKYYNEQYLNNYMNIFLALTIAFYSLWTMEQGSELILLSIPLLISIFMQYSLFIEKNEEGDPTTVLLQSKSLMITTGIYVLYMLSLFLCI